MRGDANSTSECECEQWNKSEAYNALASEYKMNSMLTRCTYSSVFSTEETTVVRRARERASKWIQLTFKYSTKL